MAYKKISRRNKRRTHSRSRKQRKQRKMQMKGGVDTPLFGDDTMTIPMENSHILDDSDITPPFTNSHEETFEMPSTDYGETTQESISNSDINTSLGFGGKRRMRNRSAKRRRSRGKARTRGKRRSLQRAGSFTITEDTSPEAYDDDYEKNLANMEEILLSS